VAPPVLRHSTTRIYRQWRHVVKYVHWKVKFKRSKFIKSQLWTVLSHSSLHRSLTAFTQLQVWNRYKLSVHVHGAEHVWGLCCLCARTEHRHWALSSVRMQARCISACWPLFSVHVHGKHRFFAIHRARMVNSTIVVLLPVRMHTVCNNNLCLNFRACARNLSPCKGKCEWIISQPSC